MPTKIDMHFIREWDPQSILWRPWLTSLSSHTGCWPANTAHIFATRPCIIRDCFLRVPHIAKICLLLAKRIDHSSYNFVQTTPMSFSRPHDTSRTIVMQSISILDVPRALQEKEIMARFCLKRLNSSFPWLENLKRISRCPSLVRSDASRKRKTHWV